MTTTPDLPEGARTKTAARSRLLFWIGVVLTVTQVFVFAFDDGWGWQRWLRLTLMVLFVITAVQLFRSWRILKRFEAQQ